MKKRIDAVLYDPDDQSRQRLNKILAKIDGIQVRAETALLQSISKLVQNYEPKMIIMDMTQLTSEALLLAERLSQSRPGIMLVMLSGNAQSEDIIRAMRSGAREFLAKPFNERIVIAALSRLLKYESNKGENKPLLAKTISLFGAKGGVGATTIATNLAASLAKHRKKSVLLVDLDLQKGNIATFLNMMPQFTVLDVCNGVDGVDDSTLKRVLEQHGSGAYLLAGSILPEDSEKITVEQMEQLLLMLKNVFEYVVIDTNGRFDEITIKALDESDLLLTILTPDLPAIFNARRCLETFRRMNYPDQKVRLILNRHNERENGEFGKLERIADTAIVWKIPDQDDGAITRSANHGQPVSVASPRAVFSINLNALAGWLNGEPYPKPVNESMYRSNILKSLSRKLKWDCSNV